MVVISAWLSLRRPERQPVLPVLPNVSVVTLIFNVDGNGGLKMDSEGMQKLVNNMHGTIAARYVLDVYRYAINIDPRDLPGGATKRKLKLERGYLDR